MQYLPLALLLLTPALAGADEQAPHQSDEALKTAAVGLIQQFAGQIQPLLRQTVSENGPAAAIPVCASVAPAVARQLSAESGWQIRRVSLQPRNPAAAPDAWERSSMTRLAEEYARTGQQTPLVTARHQGDFRVLKPQWVEPLCLQCHGENIQPEVQAAIDRQYPGDQATGYRIGELRGAISLRYGD